MPYCRSQRNPGSRHHQAVRELVEGSLGAEIRDEGDGEDDGIGGHVPAGVVPHHQHRSGGRDLLEPTHLGPEPHARQEPEERQVLADEVGIAALEVVGGGGQSGLRRLRPAWARLSPGRVASDTRRRPLVAGILDEPNQRLPVPAHGARTWWEPASNQHAQPFIPRRRTERTSSVCAAAQRAPGASRTWQMIGHTLPDIGEPCAPSPAPQDYEDARLFGVPQSVATFAPGTGRSPDRSRATIVLRSDTLLPSANCGQSPRISCRLRSLHARASRLRVL